jgi:signal transduction histidine kinase
VVKSRIIWKLLLINLTVIAFVMVIVWLSIDTLAAGYFVTLMERYHISPEPAHDMFVDAVHRYLLWACLAAAVLAALLSFIMLRRVLFPLTRMTAVTRRIAAGDFQARVAETAADEVGQLAAAFNRMAESLAKIEGLRRSLMIDVAHELRTPLTNMRGYLEALQDGVLPPTPETFALLHDETMRLADLVEDVLRLARADAARERLRRRPVDVPALVDRTESAFAARLAEKRISVQRSVAPDTPIVWADPERILRVLRSLMDNAVRYSPAGGVIEIRIEPGPASVRMTLSNTGQVRRQDLPFLFERFFRGERSRSREHGGAGIGLSIVKELVEAHGGAVGAGIDGDTVRIWFELPQGRG